MGSEASKAQNQDAPSQNPSPELLKAQKIVSPKLDPAQSPPIKPPAKHTENSNNNNSNGKKNNSSDQHDTGLDSDMHFIVDTYEAVEKMTIKDRLKRRRWKRSKDDNKQQPQPETTSAPSRLTKEPSKESGSVEEKQGILAKGKQFFRRQPAVKQTHPKTAPAQKRSVEREESEEEWDYQKVMIEGFDPEKFKQANIKKANSSLEDNKTSSLTQNGDSVILRIRNAEKHELAVPPAYDVKDEQLMASIEKEFNVK